MRPSDRRALIQDLEQHHVSRGFPRGQLALIVAGAGIAGFLGSTALLRAGVDGMWLRYPLAVACGYVAFLLLLRLWIGLQRWDGTLDLPSDGPGDGEGSLPLDIARGGRSGGGGGGTRWEHDARAIPSRPRGGADGDGSWFGGFDVDLDEGIWLAVAGVLVLGGAFAIGYVIYIAPVLLAEVTLDAALVTAVYRRLRPHDAQHWSLGVLRRTWFPALVVALCLAGAGYALHLVAPDARSIGGVIAHLGS